VGGSPRDSALDLAFGYNGVGRLTGDESGAGVRVLGRQSPLRLFGSAADQFGWLLPAAVVGLVAGLVLSRGRPRTDPERAALVLWAGWALPTAAVFSLMQGTWHSYYTVELAPAVAALTALGATMLWRRQTPAALAVLGAGSLATTTWAVSLVGRGMASDGPVAVLLVLCGLLGVLLLAAAGSSNPWVSRMGAGVLLVAALIGPATWSVATAEVPHTGASVRAGPGNSGPPAPAATGRASVPPALVRLLQRDSDDWTWTAATVGRRAADLQLAAGASVMPIGGYFGRDPAPTLARFQADVHAHRIHWYVSGLYGRGPAAQIDHWVRRRAPAVQVGSTTVYDLAGLAGGHYEDST
jgi:4-amino-4-deoxy-L-arabinose transferase-like glycosyltransferase